jgi:hypothetical protein
MNAVTAGVQRGWVALGGGDGQAEQRPGADTETLAFTLLGTVHHLILTRRGDALGLRGQVRGIVAALVAGMR